MRKGGAKQPRRTLSTGQVGAWRPFSEEDRTRWCAAFVGLVRAGLDKGARFEHDVVDLSRGRDFLAEDRRYDIVVLHSVLHPSCEVTIQLCGQLRDVGREAMVSPLHSLEKWRARLLATGARWIAACGGLPSSLDGWQLRELEGYEIIGRDAMLSVYRRKW